MATVETGTQLQPTPMGKDLNPQDLIQEDIIQEVLGKLKHEPLNITADDARRLHEHFDASDEHFAHVISAVEAIAGVNEGCRSEKIALPEGSNGKVELLTLVKDLQATVETHPNDVTAEVLRLTQGIISKMQKAVGAQKNLHPELEDELRLEFAKIEPKIEEGTVTKAEADHLHSLEARAHGHTEKGGLTAIAQSVVAKRERQASLSEGSAGKENNSFLPLSARKEQPLHDKETNLPKAVEVVKLKAENEPEKVTKEDAALLDSRDARAHGNVDKLSLAAEVMSLADKNEHKTDVKTDVKARGDIV
ncbi:hypothetical protein P154DRAFT_623056 [Amniculicola lignicola CBS 123094]|uniref:SMP domain-containing protein n=1 Tax=Amniculicola lignicola CBS 123094 TaxID=1392246 RepID=A0A6A5W5Y4_9PLEO|nr:hypothetical protein P154DRAFT_623056 [Amniculicola lignicola CBS 123094]